MTDIRTSTTPPKTKIFVGRLPEEAQSHDLRRLFERFGIVTECDILNRYGFVHMKTEEMALRAIEALHNADFMGVQISVEQSTGKKSGRSGGPGGVGGPMRGSFRGGLGGRGGMRGGMGRPGMMPPYMRAGENGRGDYGDRRPGPPPPMRNGYYDSYDRGGYDNYYPSRGPPPPIPARDRSPGIGREPDRGRSYSDLMRSPYERRSPGRSPYDRPLPPPVPSFERRGTNGDYPPASRLSSDMYRRRSPPPPASYSAGRYESDRMDRIDRMDRMERMDRMDPYGPPARRLTIRWLLESIYSCVSNGFLNLRMQKLAEYVIGVT